MNTYSHWRWEEKSEPFDVKGRSRPTRRAVIQAAIVGGIGCLFLWRGHPGVAWFLIFVAAFLFISGLLIPRLFVGFERVGKKFGQWVGTVLTWFMLVPTFFIVFFTGRFILWLMRRDPMGRQFPSPEETYWVPRPPITRIEHYTKQY